MSRKRHGKGRGAYNVCEAAVKIPEAARYDDKTGADVRAGREEGTALGSASACDGRRPWRQLIPMVAHKPLALKNRPAFPGFTFTKK